MTLSEAEITEYGDPFFESHDDDRRPDLIHQIGYFVNYECLLNSSECVIDRAGPCPLTRRRKCIGHFRITPLCSTLR